MSLPRERLAWIDRMRGLAILSVVIQHSTNYFVGDFVYAKVIGIANMAVFFFISGFIWEKTARVETLSAAGKFLVKKTRQLFLPLVVWNFVSPFFFTTDWQMLTLADVVEAYREPHLWFLLTLYGYAFYFAAFRIFSKWGGQKIGVCFWILALAALFVVWRKFGWFKFETLYFVYFAFGVLISRFRKEERVLGNQWTVGLSLVCVLLLTAFWSSGATSLTNIVVKVAVSFSVICLTYLCCTRFVWISPCESFIQLCGRCSLAIYILHWPFTHLTATKFEWPQTELLAFVPIVIYGILICYVCIGLKLVVSLSRVMNFLLFGEVLKKH